MKLFDNYFDDNKYMGVASCMIVIVDFILAVIILMIFYSTLN